MKLILTICCLFILSGAVFAQSLESDLKKSFNRFEVASVDNNEARRKISNGEPLEIVTAERSFRFFLRPNDMRAPGYHAEYTDKTGRHALGRGGDVKTFQGTIEGEAGSIVALTIDAEMTEGFFATAREGFYIEPARRYSKFAAENEKVVYRVEDKAGGDDQICGLDERFAEGKDFVRSRIEADYASKELKRRVIEIATDADNRFITDPLAANGSMEKARDMIFSIMNQVDAVFQRDLRLRFVITFQHFWDPSNPDPYGDLTDADFIYKFREYWNRNFSMVDPRYKRDVMHMFSMSRGALGRAIENTVCRYNGGPYAYTATGHLYKWVTTAHELAHNLGEPEHNCLGSIMLGSQYATSFCQTTIDKIAMFMNFDDPRAVVPNCLEADTTQTATPNYDFDGDGKADIAVFRPSNGVWYILKSSGGYSFIQWGQNKDVLVPRDYDGDGKTDIAVYRHHLTLANPTRKGFWYILRSSDNSVFQTQFGETFDEAAPADYDGDGKTDLAVRYSEDAVPTPQFFTIWQSSDNILKKVWWGTNGDKQGNADYDGDKRTDLAVFGDPNAYSPAREGIWFILQSSNNQPRYDWFGIGEDKVVRGDYEGDGRADLAVFRPSNGYWYILRSSDRQFLAVQFGLPRNSAEPENDIPVPADYDGDGKTDIAVYRFSTGYWYLLQSTKGFAAIQWGIPENPLTPEQEDLPVSYYDF